jgi:hypothetical protein|tara:strand:+ start:1616 stop:2086 length:471 start_codon:yes stop_codon:yes gene_type:complete
MSFYIEDSGSEYDSDVDNIHKEISHDPNIENNIECKEPSLCDKKETIFDNSLHWIMKRIVCFEEEINSLSNESLTRFNTKNIESEKTFECMKCAECKKNNITTTFCCLLRNESYYFCNSECWSSWINTLDKNNSEDNFISASNDNIEAAEQIITNS